MKRLVASLLFLVAACQTPAPAVVLPEPVYPDGASWIIPCQEHGTHTHTISGHTVAIIYTILTDDGQELQVPESTLVQALTIMGIDPNEESGQQTTEDTLDLPARPEQPSPGNGTSPTGNR